MFNFGKKKEIKLQHFRNLICVAFIDGHLDDSEKEVLISRANEYGISREAAETSIKNVPELRFDISASEEEREEQMMDAIYLTMVDGEVKMKEYELCLKIAEKLNFSKEKVEEMIEKILIENGFKPE
jgi:hypothetical protein